MEKNEFLDVMREHTDDELIEIVNEKRSDYQPKAVEAAEAVLKERGTQYVKMSEEELVEIDNAKISFAESCYVKSAWKRLLEYLIDTVIIIIMIYPIAEYTGFWFDQIIVFAYYFLLESIWGKTVGKLCLGLRIVDIDGNRPTKQKIFIRTLCRFIPFDALSFIMGGWKNHELKTNWHDRFSGTYVVE